MVYCCLLFDVLIGVFGVLYVVYGESMCGEGIVRDYCLLSDDMGLINVFFLYVVVELI